MARVASVVVHVVEAAKAVGLECKRGKERARGRELMASKDRRYRGWFADVNQTCNECIRACCRTLIEFHPSTVDCHRYSLDVATVYHISPQSAEKQVREDCSK